MKTIIGTALLKGDGRQEKNYVVVWKTDKYQKSCKRG